MLQAFTTLSRDFTSCVRPLIEFKAGANSRVHIWQRVPHLLLYSFANSQQAKYARKMWQDLADNLNLGVRVMHRKERQNVEAGLLIELMHNTFIIEPPHASGLRLENVIEDDRHCSRRY
jgi:hypothetical protein